MPQSLPRRDFLAAGALAAIAPAAAAQTVTPAAPVVTADAPAFGRIKHSVCRWCYPSLSLEDLCRFSKAMGIQSVELLGESEWKTVADAGMTCAVANGPTSISKGFNRVENHDAFLKESERLIPLVAKAGIPNMIVFSGNRAGMADEQGSRTARSASSASRRWPSNSASRS
jgi:hydroxypyruvate isomerase